MKIFSLSQSFAILKRAAKFNDMADSNLKQAKQTWHLDPESINKLVDSIIEHPR